jgi:hypothetical protein
MHVRINDHCCSPCFVSGKKRLYSKPDEQYLLALLN